VFINQRILEIKNYRVSIININSKGNTTNKQLTNTQSVSHSNHTTTDKLLLPGNI